VKFSKKYSWALSLAGGALLGLSSFSFLSDTPAARTILCLIALCPLCWSFSFRKPSFLCFFLYLLGANLVALYWVPFAIQNYSGCTLALALLGSLVLYPLNCLPALVAWFLCKTIFTKAEWLRLVLSAVAWALAESFTPRFMVFHSSSTLIDFPFLALWARVGGTFLVTVLTLLWIGSCLLCLQGTKKHTFAAMFLGLSALSGVHYFYSSSQIQEQLRSAPLVNIGLVSPELSVKEDLKPERLEWRTNHLANLSREIPATAALDLLIWPESAYGHTITRQQKTIPPSSKNFPLRLNTPLLAGGQALSHHAGDKRFYFNQAFLLEPSGQLLAHYDKQVLFPFSEKEIWPFEKAEGPSFAKGKGPGPKELAIGNIKIALSICYEDKFSRVFSKQVRENNSNLLITLTNDGWFKGTEAPFQHELVARWRAIENSRFLIRATNLRDGALISPRGLIINKFPEKGPSILVLKNVPLTNA